ncbi:c-type cytochrome [Flavobacterium sp.]|uniref:c-type cytochrome n=1 Tax=Flavobacterium sp. TaxID=239 RepID=UPI0026259C8E|nr:c-type cytochrome [Flavobacterium sp.]
MNKYTSVKIVAMKKSHLFCILALACIAISCGRDPKKTDNYSNEVNPEKTVEETKKKPDFPLAEQGKALFEGEGTCVACHKLDTKVVGPSIQEIVAIYKAKNASIAAFLNEESEPIVDPSQYSIMKANFAITKNMKPEQRLALEQYMMSLAK